MKATFRKQLRAARRALTPADHALRSRHACSVIMRMPGFKAGARVAMYLPFDREVDTTALTVAARVRGIRLYVPVIVDLRHRRMRFYPLKGPMRPGWFGISVPRRHAGSTAARWLNLIVVPLVGIDGDGFRLGMGGGFYDRALKFRRTRRLWKGPEMVGLGFECQRTGMGFADPWDVRLDSFASESGLRRFTKGTQ